MAIYSDDLKVNLSVEYMSELAIGSIDYAMEEVSRLRSMYGTCIDDTLYHLRRARESLTQGVGDTKQWSKEAEEAMKIFILMMPYLIHLRSSQKSTSQYHSTILEDTQASERADP